MVSVPTTQTGVPAGTGVTIHEPATQFVWTATGLYVPYETNYDPSEMRLELYQHHSSGQDELIWQQVAGHRTGNVNVLDASGRTISADDSIYFRVVAVPEPSQVATMILGCSSLVIGREDTNAMLKSIVLTLSALFVSLLIASPLIALTPSEVLVVYNANLDTPSDHADFNVASETVAGYPRVRQGYPTRQRCGSAECPVHRVHP